MMVYIFLFILLIYLFNLMWFHRGNFLEPSLIVTIMIIICTVVYLLNYNKWGYILHEVTIITILSGLIIFHVGSILARTLVNEKSLSDYSPKRIVTNKVLLFFLCLFLIGLLYHFYQDTLLLARKADYNNNGLLILYVRTALLRGESRDALSSYSFYFAQSTAYIFIYIEIFNIVNFKKITIRNYVPIFIFLVFIILNTGRNGFIYLIMSGIILYGILYMQKKNWNPKYMITIIRIAIVGLLVFFVIFVLAGSLKSDKILSNVFDTLSYYTGSSIPALDHFLTNPHSNNEYFGQHTLYGIYEILRKFSNSIPVLGSRHLEMLPFGKGHANVYTIFRRLIQDFHYVGMLFLMFIFGFSYSLIFYIVKNKTGFSLLFYAMISYPLAFVGIDEIFFANIFSISGFITFIFFPFFLYKLFIDNKQLKKNLCYILR